MSPKNKGQKSKSWRTTCATCSALLDSIETLLTLLLAAVVFCLFYLTTLEELPCPNFIIRQLESKLETQGVSLRMESLQFHPDGRIRIDAPVIYSNDLQSTLGTADSIMIKISLPLLLFGKMQIEEITVSNGTLRTPPMLSPSGVSEKLVHAIDIQLERSQDTWTIHRARLQYANLKVFAHGDIGEHLLSPSSSNEKEPPAIRKLILRTIPQLAKSQSYLRKASSPTVTAHFYLDSPRDQSLSLQINADAINGPAGYKTQDARIRITGSQSTGLTLDAAITEVHTGHQDINIHNLALTGQWETTPTKDNWYPDSAQINISKISKEGTTIAPSLLLSAQHDPLNNTTAHLDLGLGDRTLHTLATGNLNTQQATIRLNGLIGKDVPNYANLFTTLDLARFAQFDIPPYLELTAKIDSFSKIPLLDARVETDFINSHGAKFDRSRGHASIHGPQIRVHDLWAISGTKSGFIDIGFNTDTYLRRFLINGNFDPNNLNLWFGDWWKDFWANFRFPEDGAYSLLDSQSTFLQPSSIRVTGTGQGYDFGIRGEDMNSLWLKYNIYDHHFDLFDIEITRDEGAINGDTRLETSRDPRDNKDKLTAIWVDATSTVDLSIAPEILFEIRDATAEILDPYQYQIPPKVIAKSSSIMDQGIFRNDIDLRIETDTPLNVFHFPFQHVYSDVHVDNDIITIDNGIGGIGGGTLQLEANIIDSVITLETSLKDANLGQTLHTTSRYFAAAEAAEIAKAIANDTPLPETKKEENADFNINELIEYEGILDTTFNGKGIVGDSLSFEGNGSFNIREANLKKLQMFGLLSNALEKTPLAFTTLKFTKAEGTFIAQKRFIDFPEPTISGPLALIKSKGRYDLENDNLDFQAKLFPFRKSKMPITAIMGLALEPFSHALEIQLSGPLKQPEWSVFKQSNAPEETTPQAQEKAAEAQIDAELNEAAGL